MTKQTDQDRERAIHTFLSEDAPRPWREMAIDHLLGLGLTPSHRPELRLSIDKDGRRDLATLAQQTADAFFTAFALYPSELAAHPAVAALFEASERRGIVARAHLPEVLIAPILGMGFTAIPLPLTADPGLDTETIAARFALDADDPAWTEAFLAMAWRVVKERGRR